MCLKACTSLKLTASTVPDPAELDADAVISNDTRKCLYTSKKQENYSVLVNVK